MAYTLAWTQWGVYDTTPEKFDNVALFLQIVPPSNQSVTEKELFENVLQIREIENAGFLFSCERKHVGHGASRKEWRKDNYVISSNQSAKWSVIADFFKISFSAA